MNNLTQTDLNYVNTLAMFITQGENQPPTPPQGLPIDVQNIIAQDQSVLSNEEKIAELQDLRTKIQQVHAGDVPPFIFKEQHPLKAAHPMDPTTEQHYQKTVKNIEVLEHIAKSKDLIERNPMYGNADTKLFIGGVYINCHKAHLIANCGLLRIGKDIDAFYNAEKIAKGTEIDPHLYDKFCKIVSEENHPEVMSAVLRYLYTGKVEIQPEFLPEYYKVCEKLKINGRERMGTELVITKENAAQFAKVADKIDDETIADAVKAQVGMAEEKAKIPDESLNKIASFSEIGLGESQDTGRAEFEEKPVGKEVGIGRLILLGISILIRILAVIILIGAFAVMFTSAPEMFPVFIPLVIYAAIVAFTVLCDAYRNWIELQSLYKERQQLA